MPPLTIESTPCPNDFNCPEGQFCYIVTSICVNCLNCSKFSLGPGKSKCAKTKDDCGDCAEGYVMDGGDHCVAVRIPEQMNAILPGYGLPLIISLAILAVVILYIGCRKYHQIKKRSDSQSHDKGSQATPSDPPNFEGENDTDHSSLAATENPAKTSDSNIGSQQLNGSNRPKLEKILTNCTPSSSGYMTRSDTQNFTDSSDTSSIRNESTTGPPPLGHGYTRWLLSTVIAIFTRSRYGGHNHIRDFVDEGVAGTEDELMGIEMKEIK